MSSRFFIAVCYLLTFSLALMANSAIAESETAHAKSTDATSKTEGKAADKKNKKKLKAPPGMVSERTTEDTGIYYGHVGIIDKKPFQIVVYPIDPKLKPRTFLLDASSKVFRDKIPTTKKQITKGQKIAVRFVGLPDVTLVEAIYLVSGEFNPKDYLPPQPKASAEGGGGGEH